MKRPPSFVAVSFAAFDLHVVREFVHRVMEQKVFFIFLP